ncbi:carbohydrate ABC transporter permease [Kocuria turfanensis]|uniref:ABC transporter permease n=1 Tax=Kocuria turfanensis TaxID=388357 RepID=A0A512IAY4_9MICC|nr:sugar ABC transporter permease [Kocuria turfanensis]GEO94865.1 ABC transporter permease [Kocuria turfanensis]
MSTTADPDLGTPARAGTAPTDPSPPTSRRRPRRRTPRYSRGDRLTLIAMAGIPALIVLTFVWGPALASVGLSFTRWNGVTPAQFVGLANYEQITTIYPPFWPALRHNLIWLAVLLLVATPLGLLLAIVLDREIRGSRFYQSVFYLPVVLSLALVGFIWTLIYSPDQGLLNQLSGSQVNWLGDPDVNLWAVLVAASWRHIGYIMVLYLAGLKGVDNSLREAAALDGAGPVQTFLRVVFPTLRPINVVVLVVTVIEGLRAFDIVYIINKGTNGLELLSVLITNNIVGEASRIGFGSALAVILLVISLAFIITYLVQMLKTEDR